MLGIGFVVEIRNRKRKEKRKWEEICREYMVSTVDLRAHAKPLQL